jgi:osmotically-inducible protein OsmY
MKAPPVALEGLLTEWRARLATPHYLYWEMRTDGLWVRGNVPDLATRMAITEGVTAQMEEVLVMNEITVACPDVVSDNIILRYVRTALNADEAIVHETLTIEVAEGIVSLIGEVGNAEELARVIDVATTVRGVRGIVNLLRIAPEAQQRDLRIVRQVMDRLAFAREIDDRMIRVMVANGTVVLLGAVATDAARHHAEQIATAIEGVAGVRNRLQVG